MSKLNCPNCGAPIQPENNKCAYCGTSYFDLSAISIGDDKPFYLKLKINNNIVTQLVTTTNISATIEDNDYYAYNRGDKILSIPERNMRIDMQFYVIPNQHQFYIIQTEG